jgi:hypothetical protein
MRRSDGMARLATTKNGSIQPLVGIGPALQNVSFRLAGKAGTLRLVPTERPRR